MPSMKTFALTAAKSVLDRRTKKTNTNVIGSKTPMATVNKLRIWLAFTATVTGIAMVIGLLLVFAGSKPGLMEDLSVFTLNVSRIGEGLHQKVDGAIAGFNLDDLHIDLKRDVPVYTPATMTPPPTTLLTMAPRGIKSSLESLTDNAGDGIKSAESSVKSAAHSKASAVKSQASSAANSVESGVNSGLDSAAKKIKAKLTELVDDSFKDIIAALDLQGFYSIHVSTTCEGDYIKGDGADAVEHKKTDSCKKASPLNPMSIVAIFYWAGIIFTGVAAAFNLIAIYKPGRKWIKWTLFFLCPAFFMMGIASALSHGIAEAAERVINFIGNGISVDGIAGMKFIATTWAVTCLILINGCILLAIRWYIKKHPESTSKTGFSSGGGFVGMTIGQPQQVQEPLPAHLGGGGGGYVPSGPAARPRDSLDDEMEMKAMEEQAAARYASAGYASQGPPPQGYQQYASQPPRGPAPGGVGWQ